MALLMHLRFNGFSQTAIISVFNCCMYGSQDRNSDWVETTQWSNGFIQNVRSLQDEKCTKVTWLKICAGFEDFLSLWSFSQLHVMIYYLPLLSDMSLPLISKGHDYLRFPPMR